MCSEVEVRVDIIFTKCKPDRSTICSSGRGSLPGASLSAWFQLDDTVCCPLGRFPISLNERLEGAFFSMRLDVRTFTEKNVQFSQVQRMFAQS